MISHTASIPPIVHRLAMSVVGGLLAYVLNLAPYLLLTRVFHWSHDAAYAVSLSWITVLMFFWNYRVNFPTPSHWHGCVVRYVVALVTAWIINFLLVRFARDVMPVSAAIFVVGFFVAALKFGIYHWWVFPHRKDTPAE